MLKKMLMLIVTLPDQDPLRQGVFTPKPKAIAASLLMFS